MRRLLATSAALALLPATALASSEVIKHASRTITLAPGKTRTVTVPYPDALKYGNATYSGRTIVLGAAPGAAGSAPERALVKVSLAGSVLGGSEYQARITNTNPSGTAPERVKVIATTVEPLPHG